jgi:hypothetical protein
MTSKRYCNPGYRWTTLEWIAEMALWIVAAVIGAAGVCLAACM